MSSVSQLVLIGRVYFWYEVLQNCSDWPIRSYGFERHDGKCHYCAFCEPIVVEITNFYDSLLPPAVQTWHNELQRKN